MLKPTILSLSLLTVMSGAAVAPALARIAEAFPETGDTSIKLILTTPAIFIIVFSLLSGKLAARISKRLILAAGLLLYIVGGVGGGLADRFDFLLVCRGVLGAGVGLVMPLATGLIADFFSGDEKARMLGFSTAASNLGGIIATLASGLLAALGWRYSFSVYGLGVIVLILVLAFLPEPKRPEAMASGRVKLPFAVYAWGAGVFAMMLAFYAIPVNIAIFLDHNALGGASKAGLAMSATTACGFVAGLTFARIKNLTRTLLPVVLLAAIALGYLLLSQASALPEVLVGVGMVGIGMGWTMPALFNGATHAGGKGTGVQVMAIVTSLAFAGQFLSPVILGLFDGLSSADPARTTFLVISAASGALLLIVLFRRIGAKRAAWQGSD